MLQVRSARITQMSGPKGGVTLHPHMFYSEAPTLTKHAVRDARLTGARERVNRTVHTIPHFSATNPSPLLKTCSSSKVGWIVLQVLGDEEKNRHRARARIVLELAHSRQFAAVCAAWCRPKSISGRVFFLTGIAPNQYEVPRLRNALHLTQQPTLRNVVG